MDTTQTLDEEREIVFETPGSKLKQVRQDKGYGIDYVAGKLHLRIQVVELLEADDYDNMPEPVFIKGYLRAYAKLLEENPDELLELFNTIYKPVIPPERTLWQSKKEINPAEKAVRVVTALFALSVFIAVSIWWYNSSEHSFKKNNLPSTSLTQKTDSEIRLTDLSKMRSLLSASNQYDSAELTRER